MGAGPDGEGGRQDPALGVLLVNVGTPAAPTPAALRRYLREFLSDPRVVDLPRLKWWPILHLFVLPFRPRRSARLYAKIWTGRGSPLLAISRGQAGVLQEALQSAARLPVRVSLGMGYGEPSVRSALRELCASGCRRILCLPLFPQCASATTGSAFDRVTGALSAYRSVPELRFVCGYHDDPAYVGALARSVRDFWEREGDPARLLISFHGLPRRYAELGDPYPEQCRETARLLAARLGLADDAWAMAYQSRFGREEWLRPCTDETLRSWAGGGVEKVDVICPGFSADCVETLEEIAITNRDRFLEAGGKRMRYIPALNDRPDHIRALAGVVLRNLSGWEAQPLREDG